MYCTDLRLVNNTAEKVTIYPLRCKCWTCEHCQPMRHAQLVRDGMRGRPNTFLTLTSNPKTGKSPDDRARSLVIAWRKVRKEICKEYGYKKLPFMAVFEATKAGEPHLHILARCKWIDQGFLSRRMAHHIGAPIVDIRRVKNTATAVHYVTKYVGKQPHHFKGTKRYWRSLDFLLPFDEPEQEEGPYSLWHIRTETAERLIAMFQSSGYTYVTHHRGFTECSRSPP